MAQKADEAARAAHEKAVAVRQLRQKLDATKARVASNREKIEEYSRYRSFLEHITPQVRAVGLNLEPWISQRVPLFLDYRTTRI